DNYKSIGAIYNMLEAIERQDSAVLIYINVDRQNGIGLFSENSSTFLKWYHVEYNNITEHGEKDLIEKVNKSYTGYLKLFSELQEIRMNQNIAKSVDFYNSTIQPEFSTIKKYLKELIAINEKAMFSSKDQATQNTKQSMYIILIMTFFALTGGFLASRHFINIFLNPINSLIETMKSVKAGDINRQADVISHDEIGEMAQEFNNMTRRLQQYEQSTLGKLLSEKNKSLAIVKSIADPLIVLDTNYRIVLLNNACEKFFSINEEKVTDRHFLEAIKNGELFSFISDTFESDEDTKQKIILLESEHEEYYFNVIVTVIKDYNTNLTGLIIAFQNVTQLKQLEKIRTDFIATISHEFKTPLTSIMMGANLMLNKGMGALNAEQTDVVNAIQEDGERLASLVANLLELIKIESGKAIYKFEPHAICSIIENSIKQFYQQAEQKEISLYYECEDDLPRVKADYEKITWVLNNLVSNALKYTNAGDEICVSALVNNGKMLVKVKDTGAGIPEEYLDRIFDKFVQVKDGDPEIRGTGLGLAVVREMIEAHGGEIWCESKLDSGSSFTFSLNFSE
ncbi:MAG: HAMP domain-containing protein, partial [Ruminiclostridium sp.]|nr:HAMP domain-containing protein [Ruminiclostridium sp.]